MTKKIFIFVSLFIGMLLFVLLVGGTVPYFIFYVYSLTFLVPLVHSLIILGNLKASIKIPEGSFYVGDKILVEYSIKNNSIFYIPYLKIKSSMTKKLSGTIPQEILTSLEPKAKFTHKENILMKKRGYYELGEIQVSIKDVFGLFPFKKKISSDISILIYPETIKLNTFQAPQVGQLGNLLINDPIFQDKSRVSSLRDYREGDSIKAIHWKLLAKLDNLVVKDYENRGDTNVVLFIDNYKKVYKKDVQRRLEDKVVDISLSIIDYYLNQNILVSLKTQDNKRHIKIQGKESSHIKPFLDTLARFTPNGDVDFTSFFLPQIELLKKDTLTIIVTPALNKSIGSLGILLKTKNLKPLFIIIIDKLNNSGFIDLKVEGRLRKEGIAIYILDYTNNIREVLEG